MTQYQHRLVAQSGENIFYWYIRMSILGDDSVKTQNLNLNGGIITNVGLPINSTDVVNKTYLDNVKSQLQLLIEELRALINTLQNTKVNLTEFNTLNGRFNNADNYLLKLEEALYLEGATYGSA